MKDEEFSQLFPEPDYSFFHIDGDGNVLYGKDINGELDDVSEPAFWQDKNAVKKLGLSTNDYATYLMDPMNFLKNYKRLHNLKFSKKELESFWKPAEWSFNPDSKPLGIILKQENFNFENFRIYVSPDEFFVLNKKLKILDFSNIEKIDFEDEKNLYTLALKVMYILSYIGEMSTKNLKSENNLARSLSFFYFYYHLNKFYNYRNFSQYNTKPVENIELFQSLYSWINHHVYFHKGINYTEKELKREKHDVVQKIRREGKWVKYQTRGGKRKIEKDYLKLIQNTGNGLTKIGQILFQESCQAYVYAILGAQAKTRWKIIGDGANSFQTQNVFLSLVDEITKQNNLSNLIKSMRLAIKETKVRLDFVISPGLELLPSQMVYIKDSPGYNNILLISNSNMKFGENNVNSIEKREKEIFKSPTKEVSKEPEKQNTELATIPKKQESKEISTPALLTTSFISAVVLRFLWLAL